MVPPSTDDPGEWPPRSESSATDGGEELGVDPDLGFDPDALYRVVRAAMKDAILDTIGTLLLTGIAFVFVVIGGQLLFFWQSIQTAAVGAVLLLLGLYLGAATLGLIPPVREWF